MTVATYEDVAVALGRPISDNSIERSQIEWWLEGIELFITTRLGPVTELNEAAVKYVEVEAVARKVQRGGRTETSLTVAVDDGSVTRRWDPVMADDITDAWWELLSPIRESTAFSTRPGFASDLRWPRARTRTWL